MPVTKTLEIYEIQTFSRKRGGWNPHKSEPWVYKETLKPCPQPEDIKLPNSSFCWFSNWRIERLPGLTDNDGWGYASRMSRLHRKDRKQKIDPHWNKARRRVWSRVMRKEVGEKVLDFQKVISGVQKGLLSVVTSRMKMEEIIKNAPESSSSEQMITLVQAVKKNIAEYLSALDEFEIENCLIVDSSNRNSDNNDKSISTVLNTKLKESTTTPIPSTSEQNDNTADIGYKSPVKQSSSSRQMSLNIDTTIQQSESQSPQSSTRSTTPNNLTHTESFLLNTSESIVQQLRTDLSVQEAALDLVLRPPTVKQPKRKTSSPKPVLTPKDTTTTASAVPHTTSTVTSTFANPRTEPKVFTFPVISEVADIGTTEFNANQQLVEGIAGRDVRADTDTPDSIMSEQAQNKQSRLPDTDTSVRMRASTVGHAAAGIQSSEKVYLGLDDVRRMFRDLKLIVDQQNLHLSFMYKTEEDGDSRTNSNASEKKSTDTRASMIRRQLNENTSNSRSIRDSCAIC